METPYLNRLHRALCTAHTAEPPTDPPVVDDATYERNVRNSCRTDAIEALGTVISRLDELNYDGVHRHTQKYLEQLQEYLTNDMEQD